MDIFNVIDMESPIILVDTMTLVHALGARHQDLFFASWNFSQSLIENIENNDKDSIEYISLMRASLYQELSAINFTGTAKLIFALDHKSSVGYWRNEIYPDYKGNRNKANAKKYYSTRYREEIKVLIDVLAFVANDFGTVVSIPNYEADDLWGATWRYCKNNSLNLIGVTVDWDWAQLIDEQTSIWDFRFSPNNRDLPTIIELIASHRDYKTVVESPSEIIAIKQRKGDRGDNLPPGCQIELIDLRTMPEKYAIDFDERWASRVFVKGKNTLNMYIAIGDKIYDDFVRRNMPKSLAVESVIDF
jgi:5'-3' exonuclease